MPFLKPEYKQDRFVTIVNEFDEFVNCIEEKYFNEDDYNGTNNPQDVHDYDYEPQHGWYYRLSAPGFLDCTDWTGPFETLEEAKISLEDTYDCDAETGESFE